MYTIDDLMTWKRRVSQWEMKCISNCRSNYDFTHIAVVVSHKKGFLNSLLKRKRIKVYIDGHENIDVKVKGNTSYSWWYKNGKKWLQ